jgi:hypothetical protein
MLRLNYQQQMPEALLARGDELSWNNNWIKAAPLYAEAEQRFQSKTSLQRRYARM